MTELSWFWDGFVTGDAVEAPYTAYKFREVWRKILSYDKTSVCVLSYPVFTYVDANSFTISPFSAFINGIFYISTATETITINRLPVGDSVCTFFLRVNVPLKTARMIMGSAVAFTAYGTFPSPTQTETIWEVPLAHILATPAAYKLYPVNNMLVHNQRNFIPLIKRQGGDATDWSTSGTTEYIPTNDIRMQMGVIRWTGAAAASGNVAVTFPEAFDDVPICFANVKVVTSSGEACAVSTQQTASTLTIYWRKGDGSTFTTLDFNWIAIGPLAKF